MKLDIVGGGATGGNMKLDWLNNIYIVILELSNNW
jgi:hypothetical protein